MTIKNQQELIDALCDSYLSNFSDRQLGRMLTIDHTTVSNYRKNLISQGLIQSSTTKVVTRNGSFCEMNTERIGKNTFPVRKTQPLVRELYETGKSDPGFVYIAEGDQCFKIGKTKFLRQRFDTFNVKLPFSVKPILLIKCQEMSSIERQLHCLFAELRLRGEWFDLQPVDIQQIAELVKPLAGCEIVEMTE